MSRCAVSLSCGCVERSKVVLREQIAAIPAKAVIPPRANRREQIRWSKAIYKHRNLVERFFCRIKQFRRSARTAGSSEASRPKVASNAMTSAVAFVPPIT